MLRMTPEPHKRGAHAPDGGGPRTSAGTRAQAVKLLPQPQPPLALGLLNVNPEPCMELT